MKNQTRQIARSLRSIINDAPGTIRAKIAEEALSHEDPVIFFHDLMVSGCAGGMIGFLIYYTDTHLFFDEHYKEIEQLREETEDSTGEPLRIQGDLKNWLAWFAFEETAYRIGMELEIL